MLDWQLSFLYYMLFYPNNQEKYEMKKGSVQVSAPPCSAKALS